MIDSANLGLSVSSSSFSDLPLWGRGTIRRMVDEVRRMGQNILVGQRYHLIRHALRARHLPQRGRSENGRTSTPLNPNLIFSFFLPQNSPFVNPLRPSHQNFFKIHPKPLYNFKNMCYTVRSQGHGTADALGEVVRNRILPSLSAFRAPRRPPPIQAGYFFAHPKQSRSGSPLIIE